MPETTQPYHAGFGAEQVDPAVIKRLSRIVARCASQSIASLLGAYHRLGWHPRRLSLVVGSTADPTVIANPHIRAHAQEGRLFRTVLEAAAAQQGLPCSVILERDIYRLAARAFGGSPARIQEAAKELGRSVGPPWGADQKAAAVAAWLSLA